MSAYIKTGETNLEAAKRLWEELGDIPLEENSDNIVEPFLHFEAGEDRFEIWSWFEETFDVSVAKDLMCIA